MRLLSSQAKKSQGINQGAIFVCGAFLKVRDGGAPLKTRRPLMQALLRGVFLMNLCIANHPFLQFLRCHNALGIGC